MTDTRTAAAATPTAVVHVDVLIVGAGISGIGAAHHVRTQLPDKRFVVLESQEGYGGTWRTHRYPGVRSDSDLFTFGYRFKPWVGAPIASGEEIMRYLGDVIDEAELAPQIRYQHVITAARWSSEERRWSLDVTRTDTGEELRFTTAFLWMCQGYYRHAGGYTPEWDGLDRFQGQVVHPQSWPDDLDVSGKRVVVIGSGATAATLIPALAPDCGHITMLQRSPTFFVTRPNGNELADLLRELEVPDEWVHEIVRRKIVKDGQAVTKMSFEEPEALRELLVEGIRAQLPPDFDVDKHFNPPYRPWQQRLAVVPDGDLFRQIREGKASVVTDQIDSFTETGILLRSGEHLEADVVVTATGFDLSVLGDIAFTIDDEPMDFARSVTYHGVLFSGVPNLAWVFGYFRASWTLRADLIADFVCRLLGHMDELGATKVVPTLRPEDADMVLRPWVDPEDFNPGYLSRSLHLLPKQGDRTPWLHSQDYVSERAALPAVDFDDGTLELS